jgi:hypothetical protein
MNLHHSPNASRVQWSFHTISDVEAIKVARKLESSPDLQVLTIMGPFERNDESLGSEGGKAIFNAVKKHPKICSLNLEGNNRMGDDVADAIHQLLVENKILTSLNIRDCGLTEKAASQIAEGLKMNKTLTQILIDTNCFGKEGRDLIKNAAKDRYPPLTIL